MIIEDKVKLKKRVYKKKDKEYVMYFTTFSIKYSDILKKFKELQNIEIITDKNKIVLPKVNLFKYSYYVDKKTKQKIPQYSFVIPKNIGEELEKNGVRNLKVIAEVPDLITKS
ncbi:hypothetical protein WIW90_13685 [Sulfolobaceae archaeon RB850M]